ncbi:LamG-like jellyroll fold domain-containing protein [Paenibacillus sp. FSL W7-1287]|uniref:LamG-like jellyroll fold domain-containing protein n=1 Tax=Paenibacillus sp. FSL W7-1287 TaxID=2954538 RepID=UPI0030F813C7
MKKKLYFRVIAIVLAFAMALPITLQTGYAASVVSASDIEGHWAEEDFTAWTDKGLISSEEDGSYQPNKPVTRAEFAALINAVFNLQEEAEIAFKDVQQSAPYYSDIMKAVAAGYMNGYGDGTMRPFAPVSRQEAAVILHRVFQLALNDNDGSGTNKHSDVASLPEWSRAAVAALVNEGYVHGYLDGTFKPQLTISKAEAIRLIGAIGGELLVKSGTYKALTGRNAVVNTPGVIIEQSTFTGNVYVTEGAADGEFGLDHTSIDGTLYVAGASKAVTVDSSSVGTIVLNDDYYNEAFRLVLAGTTSVGELVLQSTVRVVAEEGVTIDKLVIDGLPEDAVIELIGSFGSVEVRSTNKPTIKLDGTIGSLSGEAANVVEGKLEDSTVTPTPTSTPVTNPGPVTTPSPTGTPAPSPVPDLTEPPLFRNDSVHDPSINVVDDMYYVFGSHLAAAKSPDLLQWETFASGVNSDNPLFDDVLVDLKEAFEWAELEGLWAADVIELNGKYYMYYNACRGDAPISALGIAVADDIEGPYVNQGIILKSGKGKAPLNDANYNANIHPNAIDPHLFFDEQGKLWMVYGSYSGGIFIMEMDAETGLPIAYEDSELNSENDGYGRKLMGGNHARIEAPYIQYVPESGYYYLYVTFGGLDAVGGYNMRVSRSLTPEGPYYDAEGNDMLKAAGKPGGGLVGNDVNIAPYGVKQLGNYVYDNLYNEANYPSYGYVSAGHNSTYYDEDSKKLFNIFHSRFPNRGEQHEIRVHQMWINEDGWPVMAPHRYSGETIRTVTEEEIVGPYHFINHGKEITSEIFATSYIEMLPNGQITGSITGTWELSGERGYDVKLSLLENEQEVQYSGVFARLWDATNERYTMTFTASSQAGVTVWGSQLPTISDQQLVDNVSESLHIGDATRVYKNLSLITVGALGSVIEWESSDESIVQVDGTIHRPAYGSGDAEVTLTAKITRGDASTEKVFELIVKEQPAQPLYDGMIAHYGFEGALVDQIYNSRAGEMTGNRIDNGGGTITYSDGVDGQAAVFNGESGIRLPEGLINNTSTYSVSLWLKPEQLTDFTTTFFGAVPVDGGYEYISIVPKHGFWNNMVAWGYQNGAHYDAHSHTVLPLNEWTQVVVTVESNAVNVYVNGSLKFTGTGFPNLFGSDNGQFALGVNYWDLPFKGKMDELRIYDVAIPAEQVATQYEQDRSNVWALKLSASQLNLVAGGTASLSAAITPASASDQPLQWHSTDEAVATVASGVVTAVAAGEAVITVSSVNDPSKRAEARVTVTEQVIAVETIDLEREEVVLRGGAYIPSNIVILPDNASIKELSWSIDDAAIADIHPHTGKVIAKSEGSTTVTATAVDGSGVSASYTLVVSNEGLLAHYAFEDNLNNGVVTAFGSGTVIGGKVHEVGGSITYGEGVTGQAASFDGQSGVRLPDGLIADDTYTVAFWLKPEQLTPFTTTFFGARTGDDWISFVPQGHDGVAGNTMLWSTLKLEDGASWIDAHVGSRIAAGQWVHIAFTVAQNNVTIYIDGVNKYEGSFNNVFTDASGVFTLGVNYWDVPYKGLFDELRIYDDALSAEHITYLAAE